MSARLLSAALAGALIAAVILHWLPERGRSSRSDPLAPASTDLSTLATELERLDQRLARIESSLSVRDSRGSREPVDPAAPAAGPDEQPNDVQKLSERIDALTASLRETRKPAPQYPTLEEMRSARGEVDWKFVDEVRRAAIDDLDTGLERVCLMTFDDLLRKVGPPSGISALDGSWWYSRFVTNSQGDSTHRGITLHFIRDYVMGVDGDGTD